MEKYLNFFSHEKVSDSLILFTEGYSMVHRFSIGVVVGTEKIMVIDAGLAMTGDLRKEIEKVVGTGKPMICVSTHGHIDHMAASKLFDEAYLGAEDIPTVGRGLEFERRIQDVWSFSLDNEEVNEYCKNHALHNEDSTFKPLYDGDVFDLGGGVKIEVIEMGGGHSMGSMCFYNAKENYLFTGDAINADCYIARLTKETYLVYADKLQRLIDKVGDDVTFYSGHLPLPQKIGIIKDIRQACLDLYEGKVDGDVPFVGIHTDDQSTPRIAKTRFKISGNALVLYNPAEADPEGKYDINTTCVYGYEKVSDHVYVITENNSVVHRLTIGLVVGEDRALVINTGLGMDPKLRTFIEGIIGTEKPIVCAVTHGAVDHIGGASLFDRAFMSHRDLKLLRKDNDVDHRLMLLYSLSLKNVTLVDHFRDKYLPIKNVKFENIADGDVFNLGGVKVETIPLPGHTDGSVAFYVRSEKILFTGDAVNADTYLFEMNEEDLLKYADRLDEFARTIGDDTATIYGGHLNRGQTFQTVYNLAAACREVANGDTYGDPPAQSSFIFDKEIPTRRLHYHGNTCVCYDRANFRK